MDELDALLNQARKKTSSTKNNQGTPSVSSAPSTNNLNDLLNQERKNVTVQKLPVANVSPKKLDPNLSGKVDGKYPWQQTIQDIKQSASQPKQVIPALKPMRSWSVNKILRKTITKTEFAKSQSQTKPQEKPSLPMKNKYPWEQTNQDIKQSIEQRDREQAKNVDLSSLLYLSPEIRKSLNKGENIFIEDKNQRVLVEYYKNWFKYTDKKTRDATIKRLETEQKNKDMDALYGKSFTVDGIRYVSPESIAKEMNLGVLSGATFGLSNLAPSERTKMEARSRQSWYAPYSLGEMAGSLIPTVPAIKPVQLGLKAAGILAEKAGETALKTAAKRAGKEMLADTIVGTGYGIGQEFADAAFDTRNDGNQTFDERQKNIAVNAAVGLALGGIIESPPLAFKGLKTLRTISSRNKQIDRIMQNTEQMGAIRTDLENTSRTLARLETRKRTVDAQPDSPKKAQAQSAIDEQIVKYQKQYDELNQLVDDISARQTKKPPKVKDGEVASVQTVARLTNEEEQAFRQQADAEWQQQVQSVVDKRGRQQSEQTRQADRQQAIEEYQTLRKQKDKIDQQAQVLIDKPNKTQLEVQYLEALKRASSQVDAQLREVASRAIDIPNVRTGEATRQQADEATRQSLVDRLNTALDTGARQQRQAQLEDAFSPRSVYDFNFEQQKRMEAEQQAQVEAQAEQARLEKEAQARAEFPNNPDVPVTRDDRIGYVIENATKYMDNVKNKSDVTISEGNAKIEEIKTAREQARQQRAEHVNSPQNVERAIREYDDWVKLVQTVNALTRDGGGIKVKRSSNLPAALKKGNIPIEVVAERLGMTVDELLNRLSMFTRMIALSVKKEKTLLKQKRILAQWKLRQEPIYVELTNQINQANELIDAVNEIIPPTVDYPSRTVYKELDDAEETFSGLPTVVSEVPSEQQLFSTYLVRKWFPEYADEFDAVEARIEQLQNKIDEQEKLIKEVEDYVTSEAESASEFINPDATLAQLLIRFVNEGKKKIHVYDSAEDARIARLKKRNFMKNIPLWARNLFVLKPSWVRGEKRSVAADDFNSYISSVYGDELDFAAGKESGQREANDNLIANSTFFADTEFGEWSFIDRALSVDNPWESNFSTAQLKKQIDSNLKSMDVDPRDVIDDLQRQMDDESEKLVRLSESLSKNRLWSVAELSDQQIADMIRDVLGERKTFDELLSDYMNEMYPERMVPDVAPITMEEVQNALPKKKPKSQPATLENLPQNRPQTPVQEPMATTDVMAQQTPQNVPKQQETPAMNEPVQTPVVRPEPTPKPEQTATPEPSSVPTEPPVTTAPKEAPINQPGFAEELRNTEPVLEELSVTSELPTRGTPIERGFNETARTSPNMEPNAQQALEQQTQANETADLVNNPNWYARQSNEALMNRARNEIDKLGGIDFAYRYLLGKKIFLDVDNAMAQIVIKHFEKTGDIQSVLDIINKIAPSGTELGRAIQAYSLYNRLDIDGVLILARKQINKNNRSVAKDLTQEQAQPFMDIVSKLQKVEEAKLLQQEVNNILLNKKAGEQLTDAEIQTLADFEQVVRELNGEVPKKPTADEVINATEKVEPRFRTRDAVLARLKAMEDMARKRLDDDNLGFAFDPKRVPRGWTNYVIIGASKIARGVIKFADFSEQMLKEYGDVLRPHMKKLYLQATKRFRKESGLPPTTRVETAVRKALKEGRLDEYDAENLLMLSAELGHFNDSFKTELLVDLQTALNALEKPTIGEYLSKFQTIAQLLNFKTTVRNVAGNTLFYVLEKATKLVAAPIDMVASKLSGRAREIYFFTGNQEKYWKNWAMGWKAGYKGIMLDGVSGQFEMNRKVFLGWWNPMNFFENLLGATLHSFDYAAYRLAYGEAAYSWAKGIAKQEGLSGQALKVRMEELVQNMDDEMKAVFDNEGKYMTFQDDNFLSQMFVQGKRLLNVNQKFGIGDLVLKYPKTPANLIMRSLEYSPLGLIRTGMVISDMIKGYGFDKRALVNSLSRVLMGAGMSWLAYMMYDLGIVTGKASMDKDVRSLEKQAGMSPYSVNIDALGRYFTSFDREQAKAQKGDSYVTFDWAQPMAVNAAFGIKYAQVEQERGKQVNQAGEYALAVLDTVTAGSQTIVEQPLLTGVSMLTSQYPGQTFADNFTKNIIAGAPASFVPTAMNQVRTLIDNQKRLPFNNENYFDMATNKVLDRLPGLSTVLPQEYDSLGKPVEKYKDAAQNNILEKGFNVFLNPSFVTKYNPDPVAKTAVDFIERTKNTKVAPRVPDKSIDVKNDKGKSVSVDLNSQQYSDLQRITGERQRKILERFDRGLRNPNISDTLKEKNYKRYLDRANKMARIEFLKKYRDELKKKANEATP